MKLMLNQTAIFYMRKQTRVAVLIFTIFISLFEGNVFAQTIDTVFKWPEGKKAAISLTFDDARFSQVDTGTALLDKYGVKATFFVVPSSVEQRLDGWKKAVANGHEIGNHTMTHPCTGNFLWSRKNALENYSINDIQNEITECNTRIKELLGVTAEVFAYPCGQKFVGRDTNTKSYVPLISKMFILGRGWRDEALVDPLFCDLSQVSGIEMDGKSFDEILPLIEEAKKNGQWLILAGHWAIVMVVFNITVRRHLHWN